ncbi:MAG: SulP family inorganic anion transporter [Algoriphagus sp.]|nr:SulP family inorganic anion transporter [Algoriphagus sp.]
MKTTQKNQVPKDGWAGLKENFTADASAGFVVFLLAMPLSLGIAKASDFPPIMGLVTAIIGGILVSVISGSRLTVKGPAAGLIVVVAGAVAAFGGGETGWKLALGAMVVAGLVQVLFGLFKFGKLVDIFPLSAIHGMLAAIGILIIVKQIPVFLDVNPDLYKGMTTVAMITSIPSFFANFDPRATLIGAYSLAIMLGWPYLKGFVLGKIPAPLMVLVVAIPSELAMDFAHTQPPYALLHIGNLMDSISFNADFSGVLQTGIFIKYVIMFALIGSLESLLTVKAIDLADPFRRKSNTNKDLIAVGVGNTLSALLGGLPMISEVARSSANVSQGAKTRWANFFHGIFLLVFVLVATPVIEMIPNSALAAMLITVGIKLAHPKEFIYTFRLGKEQLAIFLVTIVFTLVEDLLVGIAAGVVLKMILHLISGTPITSFFKATIQVSFTNNHYLVEIGQAAIFSNYLGIKRKLEEIPSGFVVRIDLKNTKLVDHSVMENLYRFEQEYSENGGTVQLIGLENHKPLSEHFLAGRKSNS